MNFKAWCLSFHGITDFSEGKVANLCYFPALSPLNITINEIIVAFGGYIATLDDGRNALIMSKDSYSNLLQSLRSTLFSSFPMQEDDEDLFKVWSTSYFGALGIDTSKTYEYRILPNIHLSFASEEAENKFMSLFANHHPFHSYNFITGAKTVEVGGGVLTELTDQYYQFLESLSPVYNVEELKKRKYHVLKLLDKVNTNEFHRSLDLARLLSLDFNNDELMEMKEACDAYAISLRAYAKIYSESISAEEHQSILYAANILAAYDEKDNLKQSLKTDVNFIDYIYDELFSPYLQNHCNNEINTPIREMMHGYGIQIVSLIEENARHVTHGYDSIPLGGGKHYRAQRFFPDDHMRSETDEIILQAGGMNCHSAYYRIIKVGVRANGSLADLYEVPHHYDYFKVENNLGEGSRELFVAGRVCSSTFVTKLMPTAFGQTGNYIPLYINPFSDPTNYQNAMAFTVQELIKKERELLLYPLPNRDEFGQFIIRSKVDKEWLRLTQAQKFLSGFPYQYPLNYFTCDPTDPDIRYRCMVKNQLGYSQESGSCIIFSIKSLVASIIGHELMTLHLHFMQTSNNQDYLHLLEMSAMDIEYKIKKSNTLSRVPSFFQNKDICPGISLLQESGLRFANYLTNVEVEDKGPTNFILKLKCNTFKNTKKLCEVIQRLTTDTPQITIRNGYAMLSKKRFEELCDNLCLPYADTYNKLSQVSSSAGYTVNGRKRTRHV